MIKLTDDHIDYIRKDLVRRGLLHNDLQNELVDHICSLVENEMPSGKKFIDAYRSVIKSFGNSIGLHQVQQLTIQSENATTKIMIRNYFTISWRNLRKHSLYSIINVSGLAIGLAACLVIMLYIREELSYDRFNTKADRIYRIDAELNFGGNHSKMTYRSAPEAQALLQDYPEIESTVRFRDLNPYFIKTASNAENSKEKNVIWADSTFFKIFSVNVVEGDVRTALKEPASVAISKKMAEKYFPGQSALGESLILDNNYNARVTAVYENIPTASHFHFDIVVSMLGNWPVAVEARSTSFLNENFSTYLLLKAGADAKALERKLPAYLEKHMGPELIEAFGAGFTFEKLVSSGNKYELSLTPLTDIHLYSNIRGEFEPNGNITYIYLFSSIAALILIIACINFMNLSTARSANRAKEVGVRKVMGSLRSHLVRQFLMESVLVALMAVMIAVGVVYFLLPLFNLLAAKEIQLPLNNPLFYAGLLIAAIVLGFLAGLYPSYFLSAFKPIKVLKGQLATRIKSGGLRSALVVFQFAISIFLIIGTITIYRQVNYIQQKHLGFKKDQVIIVHDAYALRPNNVNAFKAEVLKKSFIESGTISGYIPVENIGAQRSGTSLWKEGKPASTENLVASQLWYVDEDYLNTFKMEMKAGRGFSAEFPSDQTAIVLNETAVNRLGLGPDPIGKKINSFEGNPDQANAISWTVIGVVKDFNFSSLKEPISPLGLSLGKSDGNVSFRFNTERTQDVIQSIENSWNQLAPGHPLQYSFLDEDFAHLYQSEQNLAKIFAIFTGLAIVVASLGLFALTTFIAEQRTKEIGIRKVLGASVNSIVMLLSKEFGKLVVIAFIVSIPLAWYATDWWLESYAYKVEVGFFVYLIAGVVSFLIAWLTMGYQTMKAAGSNPVDALKSE